MGNHCFALSTLIYENTIAKVVWHFRIVFSSFCIVLSHFRPSQSISRNCETTMTLIEHPLDIEWRSLFLLFVAELNKQSSRHTNKLVLYNRTVYVPYHRDIIVKCPLELCVIVGRKKFHGILTEFLVIKCVCSLISLYEERWRLDLFSKICNILHQKALFLFMSSKYNLHKLWRTRYARRKKGQRMVPI